MVKQASLLSALEPIVGAGGIAPAQELSAYAVDGLTPRAAVAPSTYEQVAEVVRHAHAEGLAVIPWGGGTHMHTGNVPSRYDIALSLSRLDQVVEHEPADLTVTCQAGITLAALQRHLGQHGQLVPLGPPWNDSATIGGVLAANVSGASRHAYGAPRDFTIGLRVVTADGRITKAGGRVVKNVAGYDLCKLYIGSLGTLGVIVEATFKVAPVPSVEKTVILGFAKSAEACAFSAELQRRGLALRAVQLANAALASAAGVTKERLRALVLDIAGSPQAVDRSQRELADLAGPAPTHLSDGDAAANLWHSMRQPVSPEATSLLCKASALPTRIPALIDALEAAAGPPRILALPTVGILYASWPDLDDAEATIGRVREVTHDLGGSLVIERCPPDLKHGLDVFPEVSEPAFALMRRVKEQFDPKGVLSPGRHVRRL